MLDKANTQEIIIMCFDVPMTLSQQNENTKQVVVSSSVVFSNELILISYFFLLSRFSSSFHTNAHQNTAPFYFSLLDYGKQTLSQLDFIFFFRFFDEFTANDLNGEKNM